MPWPIAPLTARPFTRFDAGVTTAVGSAVIIARPPVWFRALIAILVTMGACRGTVPIAEVWAAFSFAVIRAALPIGTVRTIPSTGSVVGPAITDVISISGAARVGDAVIEPALRCLG